MLLFDECIQEPICAAMKTLGVESTDVRTEGLQRSKDDQLVAVAKRLGAIFVTYDLDFTSQALTAAMAREGICAVMIRRPKNSDYALVAEIILRYMRGWPELCGTGSVVISCNIRGSRARAIADLPWFRTSTPDAS